ncbi:hypothetical protein C4573_00015 [Candidatus Woesearchaeota archaeon]|nr:MAG: hypothetical protein C4573_00015 [Candidatus Woesearchaeota archaeon]
MSNTAIIMLFCILILAASAGIFVVQSMTVYKDRALFFSGNQIKNTVGEYVIVHDVYGRGTGNKEVDYLYLSVELRQGSKDPVPFATTLIHSIGTAEGFYTYNNSIDCLLNPFSSDNASSLSNASYAMQYGVAITRYGSGNQYSSGFLTKGDVATLCFKLPTSLGDGQHASIALISENLFTTKLEFTTPEVMSGAWVELYHD